MTILISSCDAMRILAMWYEALGRGPVMLSDIQLVNLSAGGRVGIWHDAGRGGTATEAVAMNSAPFEEMSKITRLRRNGGDHHRTSDSRAIGCRGAIKRERK